MTKNINSVRHLLICKSYLKEALPSLANALQFSWQGPFALGDRHMWNSSWRKLVLTRWAGRLPFQCPLPAPPRSACQQRACSVPGELWCPLGKKHEGLPP